MPYYEKWKTFALKYVDNTWGDRRQMNPTGLGREIEAQKRVSYVTLIGHHKYDDMDHKTHHNMMNWIIKHIINTYIKHINHENVLGNVEV